LNDYFIFSGQISWENAPEFISAFDVAVLPADFAKLSSGISPQKLYSYLACARSVIASDIPGLSEFFTEYDVGILFRSADSANFAEKICDFRRLPEKTICELSRNARECVEKNYSWKKIVKESLEFAVGS
jgi:glycosyltransferase involved in cell wall biosynthesis